MNIYSKVLLFLLYLRYLSADLRSPCPQVFTYNNISNTANGIWYANLTLTTNIQLSGVWIRLIFDVAPAIVHTDFGRIIWVKGAEFLIKKPDYLFEPNKSLDFGISAKYNLNQSIPHLVTVLANGKTLCPTLQCGLINPITQPLVSHGQPTTPGQWPWHAAIYYFDNIRTYYRCGGTLISQSHIVTAAHCVLARPALIRKLSINYLGVYLGKFYLKGIEDYTQFREVSNIYVHPKYNSTFYFNDIAILTLVRPVKITSYVRICCLWDGNTDLNLVGKEPGFLVGWGLNEKDQYSNTLMLAKMPIVKWNDCIYSNRQFFSQVINENSFCAGYANETSACNGDSGGGLVFFRKNWKNQTTWQLRGLVSNKHYDGTRLCGDKSYVVFTDVAKYINWIQEMMLK